MDINKFGRYTALFSFLTGTVLLVANLLTSGIYLQLISVYFVLLMGLGNGFILLIVVIHLFTKGDRKKTIATIVILLINVPVAIGYGSLVNWLQQRLPIEFINNTGETISRVEVYYRDKLIESEDELLAGESFKCTFNKFDAYYVNLRYTLDRRQYNDTDIVRANTDDFLSITYNPIEFKIGTDKMIYAD